jgi:hypothetical protein
MATTQTFEDSYWKPQGKHEARRDTGHYTEIRRWADVGEEAYSDVAPTPGDTDTTDTDYIVNAVLQGQIDDSRNLRMTVVYRKTKPYA